MTTIPSDAESLQPAALTVEQALQQAFTHQQVGQLQDAEHFYLAILQVQPNQPDANYNLGLLKIQLDQVAVSLSYLKKALEINPKQPGYWLAYIDALFQAKQLQAAGEMLAQARLQGIHSTEIDALALCLAGNPGNVGIDYRLAIRPFLAVADDTPSAEQINALVALFSGGQYEQAATVAETLTKDFPQHGFSWMVLGAAFQQMRQGPAALAPLQKAAELMPDNAQAHYNLANTLKGLGRLAEAERSYRNALAIQPTFADAHYNLASALKVLGRPDEALRSYQLALEHQPQDADTHYNLGVILYELERLDEAVTHYRQALAINPNYAHVYNNLGITLQRLGRLAEAEASLRRGLQIDFDSVEACYNLSSVLQEQGRLGEAEAGYRRALQLKPDYAEAHNNLGVILKTTGRLAEAEASFRRAKEITPLLSDAHYNLAGVLQELGRLNEAETCFRQALEIMPGYAHAYNNLGCFLQKRGQLDEAMSYFRQALAVDPHYALAHSNLIFTLDLAGKDPVFLFQERLQWDAMHAAHLRQQQPYANTPDPKRRIRIGYVSPDFRDHSAPRAFGGMLTLFDRSQFEVFAYSNLNGPGDRLTTLFKQNVTAWRDIFGLSDDAVAAMIREDRIDILVDLSGHMSGNRLLVFARKPAPIQITAWGYAVSTGMRAMDVFFSDSVMAPADQLQYFTEKVRYLPSAVGSFFVDPFPEVTALPALSNGMITFGSLNRLAKTSQSAYHAWIQVMQAIPQSRLIIKTVELDDPATRERILSFFTKAGIAADRVSLRGKSSWFEHMQTYQQIDLALDPFPHGGGVTALEGLMMGVPMINLCGTTVVGRSSASIMTTLGLSDWIAHTEQDYVDFAIRKAGDLSSLARLRQQLREMFSTSILGDPTAYARAVEQEYRKLWQEWCAANPAHRAS